MRVIEFVVAKYNTREELLQFLRSEHFVKGDTIKITAIPKSDTELEQDFTLTFCLMQILYVVSERTGQLNDKSVAELLSQPVSTQGLRKVLAEQYGIATEIDTNGGDGVVDYENAPLLEPGALYKHSKQGN